MKEKGANDVITVIVAGVIIFGILGGLLFVDKYASR